MEIKNGQMNGDVILLSRQEAAAFLGGICLTTLARLAIPQVKIRRRVFYRKADVEKWIARQVHKVEGPE